MGKTTIDNAARIVKKRKRARKAKTILFFLFLLALSGIVFYFGWIQILIPENCCAVIFTKTNNYEEKVLEPGTFIWRWQRLIPTNMTIHLFKTTPETVSSKITGQLPSAEVYSSFLDINENFTYSLSFDVIFRLDKDSLVSLVKNEGLSPENYDSWLEDLKVRFGNDAGVYLSGLSMDSLSENRNIFNSDYSEKIKNELSFKYPYLVVEQVIITDVALPDLTLYYEARRIYNDTMETKKLIYQEYYKSKIPLEQEYESRLNLLTQYGQILTQYPILIDFLSIGAEPDLAKIPIPKE